MPPKQPLPPLPNDQAVAELSDQYFQSTNLWNETFVTGPLAYAYQNSYVLQGTWLFLEPDQVTDWSGFLPTGFCESGSCVADCQNVVVLFNGNLFPSPYSTCMQFANISRSLDNIALWNQSDIVRLMSLGLDETSAPNFANIATQVTACLTDACTQNPSASSCQQICDTASLLVNDTTPLFLGIANCMAQVCAQDVSFADFDLAGIGVCRCTIRICASPEHTLMVFSRTGDRILLFASFDLHTWHHLPTFYELALRVQVDQLRVTRTSARSQGRIHHQPG